MLTYLLPIRAQEIVRLLEAELDATHNQPELYYSAWEDYLVEEYSNLARPGISDGQDFRLVSTDAVLNIEPRVEQNYWVLQVIVHRARGRLEIGDAAALIGATLTLEQFAALLTDSGNTVTVRLDVTTALAREHFNAWLDEQRSRHPETAVADE